MKRFRFIPNWWAISAIATAGAILVAAQAEHGLGVFVAACTPALISMIKPQKAG